MIRSRSLGWKRWEYVWLATTRALRRAQVFAISVGEQLVAIDKHDENGRRLFDLRGVKELQSVSGCAHRLALLDGIAQGAV